MKMKSSWGRGVGVGEPAATHRWFAYGRKLEKMHLENIIQAIYDGKLNSISYSLEHNIRLSVYCSLLHLKSSITGHYKKEHFQTVNACKLSTR